jgi:predicted MFS family arabinose efflux permease
MASNLARVASATSEPAPVSAAQVKLAHRSIGIHFLMSGIAVSSWAPMVPVLKHKLGLDDATLGLVLLGMGAGGLVTLPMSGFAMHRLGTRRITAGAAPLVCGMLPVVALAPSPWLLAVALFLFSASLGSLSIGMNAQAIEVDKLTRKPVLSSIHGLYSLGSLAGSALMSLCLGAGAPLWLATTTLAVLLCSMTLSQTRNLLPSDAAPAHERSARFVLPPPRLLLLGILCGFLFMAEGSMLDWSAVFLHGTRGVDMSLAGFGYTAYAVAMTSSRFIGDWLIHRFGSVRMLRGGALMGILGISMAVALPWPAAAYLGFGIVGMGLANTVPVVFAAAGRVSGLKSSVALPLVTTIGCSGLLVGPAIIGLVAEGVGLPLALAGIAGLLGFVAYRARAIEPAARLT